MGLSEWEKESVCVFERKKECLSRREGVCEWEGK